MNNYKIAKAEVKTIYNIEIPGCRFLAIIQDAQNDKLSDIYWVTKRINLKKCDNQSCEYLEEQFAQMFNPDSTAEDNATISYIVKHILGFDGIENYGYFDKNSNSVKMSVYKFGDHIN